MKVGIIGAGASGMAVTAFLGEKNISNLEICLFDKNNSFGKKVLLTGGGRCNLTNSIKNRKEFLSKYVRGQDLVDKVTSKFSVKKTMAFFEKNGLSLKEEDNFRIFPKSEKSIDVIRCFEKIIRKNKNISLCFNEVVEDVNFDGKYKIKTSKNNYTFDYLVIATGGNTYVKSGSSGDGYEIAKKLGHNITKLVPSLASFQVQESFCANVSGISFPKANLVFGNKKLDGGLIFTHFGISGPVVFALSAHLAYEEISSKKPYKIKFIPDIKLSFESLDSKLQELIKKNPTKQIKNLLQEILPKKFIDEVLYLYLNFLDSNGSRLSKEDRKKICHLLTSGIELNLTGRQSGEEFVTAGGVDLKEINYETLGSNKVDGLYFCGEVLNVDAVTGGFNLQFCWSSGYVIASSISEKLIY
ncbi:NAD(P)/FAD-dependent oxidoreductase [Candidatus Gracilibacteria bacterium]|nr:NAD(P)/FAD-dependent oxidoreductase [Candidatus Gracilibacteria bacterium]